MRKIDLAAFHGWRFPISLHSSQTGSSIDSSYEGLLLLAPACPNAVACIVAMAHGNDIDFALVQSIEEAVTIARYSKFRGYYLMVDETSLSKDDLTTSCRIDGFYPIANDAETLDWDCLEQDSGRLLLS